MKILYVSKPKIKKPIAKLQIPELSKYIKNLSISLTKEGNIVFSREARRYLHRKTMPSQDYQEWLKMNEEEQHTILAKINIARITQYARHNIITVPEFNLIIGYIRNVMYFLHNIQKGEVEAPERPKKKSNAGRKRKQKEGTLRVKEVATYGIRKALRLAKMRIKQKRRRMYMNGNFIQWSLGNKLGDKPEEKISDKAEEI